MVHPLPPGLLISLALATSRPPEDIGALLSPHHGYLSALLRFKCRNRDLAEDLLQETYLAFLSSGGAEKTYASEEKLRNYLITIALNKFRDWLRRNRTLVRHVQTFPTAEALDLALEHLSGDSPDPGEALADQEERHRLADCVNLTLEGLPDRHREVLLLRYRDGGDNQTLAQTLNLDIKALESLVFRAKDRFRKDFLRISRERSLDWDSPAAGEPKDFPGRNVHIPRRSHG